MKKLVSFVAAVSGLTIASSALAGSTLSGYAGNAGTIQSNVQKSGSLPFTGLSLTAFAIVALLLIAAGVVLRRRTGRPSA